VKYHLKEEDITQFKQGEKEQKEAYYEKYKVLEKS